MPAAIPGSVCPHCGARFSGWAENPVKDLGGKVVISLLFTWIAPVGFLLTLYCHLVGGARREYVPYLLSFSIGWSIFWAIIITMG